MPIVEVNTYGKPSTASPQDGQGRTATPDMKAGTHYIYYRLYTKNGPIESNNPIYSNDRFISRIPSRLVRPPQTIASLKKCLCKVEGLGGYENCTLYPSLSEKTASEDSTRLSIRGTAGPGLSDVDPMALVVDKPAAEKRSHAASTADSSKLLKRDYDQRYVYYLIYDEDSGAVSKTYFDEHNPYLGCVNTLSIPPPHTVSALKSHLIKSEEILGHSVQIFEGEGSDSAMNDSDAITLLADTFPGYTENEPIAIAYESQGLGTNINLPDNEDPSNRLARELDEARSALARTREDLEKMKKTHAQELDRLKGEAKKSNEAYRLPLGGEQPSADLTQALFERPSFTQKLKATKDWNENHVIDPRWHSLKTGDIFYTDGISRREQHDWGTSNKSKYDCYLAISSSGKLAFAIDLFTALC